MLHYMKNKIILSTWYLMNLKQLCVRLFDTHLLFIYYIPDDSISDTEVSKR